MGNRMSTFGLYQLSRSLVMSKDEARARQLGPERLFEINTGHDLMLREPRKVADVLLQMADF
jgi:hypothetical protein